MANLFELMGSSARMEPSKKNIRGLISKPLLFLIMIVVISVVTNMMPFYSDGSRMNILDGSTALMNEKGKITTPYEIPKSGPSHTKIKNKRKPLKKNAMTYVGYVISDIFNVDVYTGFLLFICLLAMMYNMVIEINEISFSVVERKLYKNAFNTEISNDAFKNSFSQVAKPAYISALIVSTFASLSFPTLLFNFGKDKVGFFFHPALLVFVALFMIKAIKNGRAAKGFHETLTLRRCSNCSKMDSVAVTNKEYVRTDTTTRDHYKINSDGSRGKTIKTESSVHDVHKYEITCENCGSASTATF